MPIQPGTRLGAYEVQDLLGQGAMGLVFRAYHEQLARQVAVKVLQALAPDPDATARFRREAQSIAQMRHPNILNVFDYGEFEATPYMVIEFVAGGSLADRLRGLLAPLPQRQVTALLAGVAAGLDHAHSLGIVHRDVKPANVLMGKDSTPIVADFGLAKLLQSATQVSATGVTTGTPAYMAPEQATGSPVGPEADRYALAAVAYQLLTGELPFSGEGGVLEMLYAHVHRDPLPASTRRPGLPAGVDRVLARGLAKAPDQRWESCAAMVAALDRALDGAGDVATTRLLGAPAAGVGLATGPDSGRLRPRRRRWAIAGAAAVMALVLGGAVIAAIGRGSPALTLAAGSVNAGDSLALRARHLPPGQAGEVDLFSTRVRIGAFEADRSGNVGAEVSIPRDTATGDHLVKLCWAGGCPAASSLHVTAARPHPSPSDTPAPPPTPNRPPRLTPAISVSSQTIRIGGGFRVEGSGYDPARDFSLGVEQGTATRPLEQPAPVGRDGRFGAQVIMPTGLQPGPAVVVACAFSAGAAVKPEECARQPVVLTR